MRGRSRAGSVKSRRRTLATPKRASGTAKPRSSSDTGSESEIVRLAHDLNDALERETAASEVLKIISSAQAASVQPVLDTVVSNAIVDKIWLQTTEKIRPTSQPAIAHPAPVKKPTRWIWGTIVTDTPVMSRAAVVAIIVASIFSFPSLSLAASDAEISGLGDKMSGAFRCSTYAQLFHDQQEQQRLFQIGLKAGRDYVEGLKSRDDPTSELLTFMRGVPTDFVVGQMYESESTHAYDEIVKYQNGLPLNQWLDAPAAKTQAELRFRQSNCSLIQ